MASTALYRQHGRHDDAMIKIEPTDPAEAEKCAHVPSICWKAFFEIIL